MVEVHYKDRLGNRLFQYCFGRIIAEQLGFKLKAEPIPGFPNTARSVEGLDYSDCPTQTINDLNADLDAIISDKSKRKIVIEGYFQRYQLYRGYKDRIRNEYLVGHYKPPVTPNDDDIVVCIRRDDALLDKQVVPFSFFKEALERASFKRMFICTDGVGDPFLLKFRIYHPYIQPTEPLNNFYFIKSFKKIIISPSTFYWWAAFLSDAREIYFPIPLEGWWSQAFRDVIDLRVNDEERFVCITCREKYKITVFDRILVILNRLRAMVRRRLLKAGLALVRQAHHSP